jgi:hypothetical protein
MVKRCGLPSQGWRAFLHNHAPDVAAMDLLVSRPLVSDCSMPSSSFGWTAETLSGSTSQQIQLPNGLRVTEAFPWDEAPRYMIRDRDRIYGAVVRRRLRAMGIRDRRLRPHPGRMALPNGRSDRSAASVLITSSSGASRICDGICDHTQTITTSANSLFIEQGCTCPTRRRYGRAYYLPTNPRRTASSIYPDLICDKDRSTTADHALSDCRFSLFYAVGISSFAHPNNFQFPSRRTNNRIL